MYNAAGKLWVRLWIEDITHIICHELAAHCTDFLWLPSSWLHHEWSYFWMAGCWRRAGGGWSDAPPVCAERGERPWLLHQALQHRYMTCNDTLTPPVSSLLRPSLCTLISSCWQVNSPALRSNSTWSVKWATTWSRCTFRACSPSFCPGCRSGSTWTQLQPEWD